MLRATIKEQSSNKAPKKITGNSLVGQHGGKLAIPCFQPDEPSMTTWPYTYLGVYCFFASFFRPRPRNATSNNKTTITITPIRKSPFSDVTEEDPSASKPPKGMFILRSNLAVSGSFWGTASMMGFGGESNPFGCSSPPLGNLWTVHLRNLSINGKLSLIYSGPSLFPRVFYQQDWFARKCIHNTSVQCQTTKNSALPWSRTKSCPALDLFPMEAYHRMNTSWSHFPYPLLLLQRESPIVAFPKIWICWKWAVRKKIWNENASSSKSHNVITYPYEMKIWDDLLLGPLPV